MIGFILLSGCNRAAEKNPRFYDAGVSRELAGHRKAQIKNLKYELSFNIPRQKEVASFCLLRRQWKERMKYGFVSPPAISH